MNKEYYILWYRLNRKDGYFIWYSDENDGIVTDRSGRIISFNSREQLLEYASNNNIVINPEDPDLHNLDLVTEWMEENDPMLINFSEFNNIWNLWIDVANSTESSFEQDSDAVNSIYNKLFWSNNLPTGTYEDRRNIPEWTEDEIRIMMDLFSNGMSMFRNSLISY